MRPIDADVLMRDIEQYHLSDGKFQHWVEVQPTVDAVPVRHGKWIDDGQHADFFPHHEWRCSECGEQVLEIGVPWFKYCPNCGARMDAERKEE